MRKTGGTASELIVGNVSVDAVGLQVFHVGFMGKACIGSDDNAFPICVTAQPQAFETGFDLSQHRLQTVLFLAFANSVGSDHNLVLAVHGRNAVVTLYRAFGPSHLGNVVVGDVALALFGSFCVTDPEFRLF